jgi:hypothetical protein
VNSRSICLTLRAPANEVNQRSLTSSIASHEVSYR